MADASPWLTVNEAAAYARVGRKIIFAAIASGRLRGAHVDGRRKIIIRREWIDSWISAAAPAIVDIRRQGAA
jgi:excisionase family DNA binding protein